MFVGVSLLLMPLLFVNHAQASIPTWDATGNYVINMEYLGTQYPHDMVLTQDSSGNLTGYGGSPVGANVYTWVITSGTVSGNSIDFLANYTATTDAVTPQTVLHVNGIVTSGTINGTWSDNYQGGTRTGVISTVSGAALPLGTLAGEDFGVVNYNTGLGILKGYTAGFGLTNATFAGATSVVVKLYAAGDVLLQTNTAILPKFNADITGTQFSSPFDVSGSFAYATDGYWVNTKETQFGQSIPATKIVATVTLSNGKVVTAENINLTGDPTTIYPVATHTIIASSGANGLITPSGSVAINDGSDQAFTIIANSGFHIESVVVDSVSIGAVSAYTFNDVTANHTIAATFAQDTVVIGGTPTDMNQCKNGGWKTFTNPTFKNQGQCVSSVQSHK